MATIFISCGHVDRPFADEVARFLAREGHDIISDATILVPGETWRDQLILGLKDCDVFLSFLSSENPSSNVAMELGAARGFAAEVGRPRIIPILLDVGALSPDIADIQSILAYDRDAAKVAELINWAISVSEGRSAGLRLNRAETAKRIGGNASGFIDDAISAQKRGEKRNGLIGSACYAVGFAVLICGIAVAVAFARGHQLAEGWPILLAYAVSNIILVGFLGACSRYAFALGKAYMSESLKASDRMHAIELGRLYLRIFEDKAQWSELKDIFQFWNIDRPSTFSGLDASQIDPQILTLLGQIGSSLGSKSKEK